MVANALWGWLQQWKRSNWQRRGKPIWAAPLWQDIAAWLEKLVVKVHHVDAHVPKSRATEEHQNNQQVDQAAKIEVAQVDLDWQRKGELFIARWAHDTSGHQGRDATYRWARDRGVDLSMDAISQVIHQCETCAAIKQAKPVKPLWYGGRWLKYKYGEAWQIDYITLPQTRQGKCYVLTMVEATTGWLETYPVPHATAWNTILGLEKQVLWRHGTPERIESDNRTHFQNNLIDPWAKEHGIEWVYHIPYHVPDSGKIEKCNGLLKTPLRAMGVGTFKHWDTHLSKANWPPDQDEEVDEAAYRHLEVASWSQALVLMGDFNHPDICWKGNTARHAQSRRFLQSIGDNFLTQVVEEPTRRGVLLDLVVMNKEGLVEDVKVEGSLGCSEFRILHGRSRAMSRITTLDFRRAHFGLFKDLLGRIPWIRALEGRGSKRAGQYSSTTSSELKIAAFLRVGNQGGRRPARMSKELLEKLKGKKEVY
ncbi:hypothetical protein GRJ2_002514200 [Grus japonensis]|uniref:Uncharacterized protein n=1 Tax=Grus japonensis TaxID=30415 RepID=A0ABC9XRZ5_GRUJA